jgi:hypothetical protein
MFQDHLRLRAKEEKALVAVVGSEGTARREVTRSERELEVIFGTVEVSRLAYRAPRKGDHELQLWLDELPAATRGRLQQAQDAGIQFLLAGVGQFDALPAAERSERAKVLMAVLLAAGHLMEPSAMQGMSPQRFAAQLAKVLVGGIGAR